MDATTQMAVVGMALPMAVGVVAGLACSRRQAADKKPASATAGAPSPEGSAPSEAGASPARAFFVRLLLVVAAGLIAWLAMFGVGGAGSWPPVSSEDRLKAVPIVGAVLVGVLVVSFGRMGSRSALGAVTGAAVMGLVATVMVIWPRMIGAGVAPLGERLLWCVAAAACAALAAWPIVRLEQRGLRISSAAILTGLAAAVGAGLAGTDSLKLGQMAFGIAAGCAGLLIVVLARRTLTIGGAAAVVIAVLTALAAAGHAFSGTPLWLALGLAAVPMCGYVAGRAVEKKVGPLAAALVRIGAAAVAAAALVAPGIIELARFAAKSGG